jgi:C4-dicarboxylate transporter
MLKRVEVVDRVQVAYSKLLEGFSNVVLIVVPPAGFVDFVPTGH